MKTPFCHSQIFRRGWTVALSVACLASLLPLPVLRADTLTQNGYPVGAPPVAPAPTLSVSVNMGHYSVDANHADVRSVLKLLFDRADKQIVFNNSVTGDVTLRLKDQPFQTVLNAICEDTFLHWTLNPKTNIYRFERDQEAIARSIARLNALNSVLAVKLSELGLNVPQTMLDSSVPGASNFGAQNPGLAAGGFGGGGASGTVPNFSRANGSLRNSPAGGASEDETTGQGGRIAAKTSARPRQPSSDRSFGSGGGRGGSAADSAGAQMKADARSGIASPGASGQAGSLGPMGEAGPAGALGGLLRGTAPSAVTQNNSQLSAAPRQNVYRMQNGVAYDQFLRQNGMVSLNTNGQKIPVADALQQLGQQANVLILLDPSVPSDEKFTIKAAIPPHSFQEVINLISSYAQLNWRYLGNQSNRILVTPTPEFQLFWGESNTPRVSTPNAEKRAGQDK